MENFEFVVPTKYIFGQGTSSKCGEIVKGYGYKNVLVVYGSEHAKKSGLLDRIEEQLKTNSIDYSLLGGVLPNPRADLVYKGIDIGREKKIDFILAVGGGSVIDTAKAIALGIPDDGDFFDFFTKKRKPHTALKVGCVLTIPAAGSESSLSTVIEKEIDGRVVKNGCGSPLNRPLFAVLDPELTYSVSKYQTACGITDMIAHILERYFTNSKGVTVTDYMCEGLLKSIIENAPIAINDPKNYDARSNIMWAGSLAHNNICGVDRVQDWASHHIEHQLSALYDVAHGAGLAVIFPAWMDYVYKHDVMRFAQFAVRVFGISMDFDDPSSTARDGIKAFRKFLHSIGMPLSFEEIGAKEEDIPHLLNMLGVDDVNKTEGQFVLLYRKDCEAIYYRAAHYKYSD
ncbi:iron-containing alcohol dehydrogenase [Succinivibrio dextrinosolvens]|uniref:iron-containing alcohol dehydrogenase n=1 Tax=Succinivibrio dextrinosolvens TaxID=83771 RepID=UPI0019214870|nr:iron-containing alcohol dehydrogenase [Succinivibrio dextrinosolvens]